MKFIYRLLTSTLIIIAAGVIIPGVHVSSLTSALLAAIAIAFLNAVLKPLLVILTIPITFLTLGLFLLVINTFIVLTADYLIDGFEVSGFWSAFLFSIILSLTTSVIEKSSGKSN
jgi:putative membrane protein